MEASGGWMEGLWLIPSDTDFALSLLLSLKIARFLKLGAAPNELLALTSGRVWTLNQHLVKSLKKPLKVWSYAKGTQERQTAPRAKQPEGHPQSDITRQGHAGFPQATDHFNLKASIKQPLKWLNRVVFISKSKDNRVLLLMIDTGKIVWK